jgi:hypothetical protein
LPLWWTLSGWLPTPLHCAQLLLKKGQVSKSCTGLACLCLNSYASCPRLAAESACTFSSALRTPQIYSLPNGCILQLCDLAAHTPGSKYVLHAWLCPTFAHTYTQIHKHMHAQVPGCWLLATAQHC